MSIETGKEQHFVLTEDQSKALRQIHNFVADDSAKVLILSGYAGTGKTSLVRMVVDRLVEEESLPFVLLASTGRAAKVLSDKVGASRRKEDQPTDDKPFVRTRFATTIHHFIYSFYGFDKDIDKMLEEIERDGGEVDNTGDLLLQFGLRAGEDMHCPLLYIIDEASMVSDVPPRDPTQATFGSGRLLQDLLNCNSLGKFIFVGDKGQLPPIGQVDSPALSTKYFRETFGIEAESVELTEIVRQAKGNDIIVAAEKVRRLYESPPAVKWGSLPLRHHKDIELVGNQIELVNRYIAEIRDRDYARATMICRANKRCSQVSGLVRPALGFTDPRLMVDELLLVTQNNLPSGLRNGDLVRVTGIGRREQRACLTFLTIEVSELTSGQVFRLFLIEDILYSGLSNLGKQAQKDLFVDFHKRMRKRGIRQGSDEYKEQMFTDPYLNALRAVYGYAITCHKSQGGEWPHVYVDMPRNIILEATSASYQWVYTAITRAGERLFLTDDFFIK